MYFKTTAFKHYSIALLAILLLSSPLFLKEKEFLSLWINQLHNPFLDQLFKYATYLGSGWVYIPVLLFALSRNYLMSLILFVSAFIEAGFVQLVLKHGFFNETLRPIRYIVHSELLHKVPGVEIHSLHSFPSGHTQTAFFLYTFLALFCKKSSTAYLFLLLALSVALSRVYLLQHFFVDVWFGSLIGYSFLVIIGLFFMKYSRLAGNPKWNQGFLKK